MHSLFVYYILTTFITHERKPELAYTQLIKKLKLIYLDVGIGKHMKFQETEIATTEKEDLRNNFYKLRQLQQIGKILKT